MTSGKEPLRRYGIAYFLDGRRANHPTAWGTCVTLKAACGNAARHVARSDFDEMEYRKAVVWDRWESRVVRVYARTAGGMAIQLKGEKE